MHTDNQLLCHMSPIDRDALIGLSELVDIKPRARLEEPGQPAAYVYFLESGMASLIYMGRGDHVVEVAVVGSRGCTGCPSILGVKQSQHGTTMQIAGTARRIRTAAFEATLEDSVGLRLFLLKFVHTQIVQRDETALAASKGSLHQRLARWLLMVSDCVRSNDILLTHDIISMMLATRRAGVTWALGHLRDIGIIEMARGHIQLRDRNRLVEEASIYYGVPETEYNRVYIPSGRAVN